MADTPQDVRIRWLREALSAHERSLLRYVTRLLGDEDKGREVVQEAFLRLWRATGESDPRPGADDHLRAWLFTVCRHRALDALRREGRMRSMDVEEAARAISPRPGPSEQVEQRQSLGRALEAIERLPATQREVIRLKFQEGLSYKEISEITGHSVGNVGTLIHVGMKALRAALSNESAPRTAASRRTP